jgi:hypothetical protein
MNVSLHVPSEQATYRRAACYSAARSSSALGLETVADLEDALHAGRLEIIPGSGAVQPW